MTAVILDFDGVIADSEVLANRILAEVLTENGFPTTAEDSIRHYMGLRWEDTLERIEALHGRRPAIDVRAACRARNAPLLQTQLAPVRGVSGFLSALSHSRRAVASSSTPEWLEATLARFGLAHHFGTHVYSAAKHVNRGKPAPDLYLYAAAALQAAPEECFVVEDTTVGVSAAAAAGMRVCGLVAGGHCGPGHGETLLAAGAHEVASDYDQVAAHLAAFAREQDR